MCAHWLTGGSAGPCDKIAPVAEVALVAHAMASSLDWVEMTAIATTVLASGLGLTAIGVVVTSKAAKDDLIATRDAAQAQIEASHRPLLIDVTPTAPHRKILTTTAARISPFQVGPR